MTTAEASTSEELRMTSIKVYSCPIHLLNGPFTWATGSVEIFDSTVVEISTNRSSVSGWGEVTTLGSTNVPATAESTRNAISRTLAPALIGLNPTHVERCYERMNAVLSGHAHAKSALDMALWDIVGKVSGLPISSLLGGPTEEPVQLYRVISLDTPEKMARDVKEFIDEGYKQFQIKVGGERGGVGTDIRRIEACAREMQGIEPDTFLSCDADGGWTRADALRVLRGLRDIPFSYLWIEEPCRTLSENLEVKQAGALDGRPLILDGCCVDSLDKVVRVVSGGACGEGVTLKMSALGGLTPTRIARDLCVAAGVAVAVSDVWGGDISSAAIVHLAHSTPTRLRLASTDFNAYNAGSNSLSGAPKRSVDGSVTANVAPGLGVEVDLERLAIVAEVKQQLNE